MSRYAVFDLETTGLSPAYGHRIVEVGVVLLDDSGEAVYEWETLLNPERDVGATEIHGLTAADLYAAPTFGEIAGELAMLLNQRVPVAHNLSFDSVFLASEFSRLGYQVPLSPASGLCTMRIAGRYLPGAPRTLTGCCDFIGAPVDAAHSAICDARGAGTLLAHYMNCDGDFTSTWGDVIAEAQQAPWPDIPANHVRRITRSQVSPVDTAHFLARLASRSARFETHPEADSYMAVLDRVLLDRRVSLHEADELVALAQALGVSREDASRIHYAYLGSLAAVAAKDGDVSEGERADLCAVAKALGLSNSDVEKALDSDSRWDEHPKSRLNIFRLQPGDRVVFTGEATFLSRADLEDQARSIGLKVTSAVSCKTKLLIAADPDSLSGKARKARELGVAIVDYETYRTMIDGSGAQEGRLDAG